jgi:hypothetical protein
MKTVRSLVFVALAVLAAASGGAAYEMHAQLTEVAHVYSLGVGEVRCPTRAEWDADFGSSFGSAYTNLRDDYTVLGPPVCEGALGVGRSDLPVWQQALGVLVFTHEAFHLRHWRHRRNEGKVECQAMVYFLYAYALALHAHKVSLFPRYRDPKCKLPVWAPPAG